MPAALRARPHARTHPARRARRSLHAAIALLVAVTGLSMLAAAPADAAIIRPFAAAFTANTNGQIILRGNTNLTCSGTGCATAQAGGAGNNNDFAMVNTDVDGDPATFNSSRAGVTLAPNSTVLFAGLYWSATRTGTTSTTNAPTPADYEKVLFKAPGGAYRTVTSTRTTQFGTGTGSPFAAFADVTALVTQGGNGAYTVANIQAGLGADRYAGWSLVIAYGNPDQPVRNLTVFDGFGSVSNGTPLDIPVSGFQTPRSGPVRTNVGAVTFEGDRNLLNDQLLLNGTVLSNAANPANNNFNSSVTEEGTPVPGRTPAYDNLLGMDADRFDASGVLANGASQATLRLTTAQDVFYPTVVTFATELFAPKVDLLKTSQDLDGGSVEPGDVLRYTVTATNNGLDDAVGTRLVDAVPINTTLVPGSIKDGGVARTDAADSDTASFRADTHQGQVQVNLGSGATGTSGGRLAVDASRTVSFDVRVDAAARDDVDLVNVASAGYSGAVTGLGFSTSSNKITDRVTAPRADLGVRKVADPAVVQRGETAGYRLEVVNHGPRTATAATLTDTLPAGTTVVSASTDAGSCTPTGNRVDCALGDLPVGSTVVVRVRADLAADAADPAVDVATVSSSLLDPVASNDTATARTVVNRPPVATDEAVPVQPGDRSVTTDVLGNDSDPDGDPLRVVSAVLTPPAHGTVRVDGAGTLTYTADPAFAGQDTVTYTVSDGRGGSDTATLTVTVPNAGPVTRDDETSTVSGVATTVRVLDNDSDPNNDPLTVASTSTPDHGVVTHTSGVLAYTPGPGFTGTDTFTYTVSDGNGGSSTSTVTVIVTNTAPEAADDDVSTPYGTPTTIAALDNDTDDNGQALTVTSVTQPAAGQGTVSIEGNALRYDPPAGFSGSTTFDYTITDPGNATSTAHVTVTVQNAPPSAVADTAVSHDGGPVDVPVLGNDSDPDGGTLRVIGVSDPSHGSVSVANGVLTYTPAPGFAGADTFTYTVSDGQGGSDEGSITVTTDNLAPVVTDEQRTTPAGVAVTVPVLVNDTDPNGDTLAVQSVGTAAHGAVTHNQDGTVTYTPANGFEGTDSFTYVVTDGSAGGTTTGTVTVHVVDLAPVVVDDAATTDAAPHGSVTVDVLANDSDGNGDPLTISGLTDGAGGSVRVVDGKVVYTYADDFSGTDTFTYTATDGRGGETAGVVRVVVRNSSPTTVADTRTTARNVPVPVDVLANDTDPNGDALTLLSLTQPVSGSVAVVDGKARFTPADGFTGAATFTYDVRDARGGVTTDDVTVTVGGNTAPVLADDRATTDTGQAVTVAVLANDTDPNGDTLRVTGTGSGPDAPQHGSATVSPAGVVTYTPATGFAGDDAFTYAVTDDQGASGSIATVRVTVRNAAPSAGDDEASTATGTPVRVPVLANDHDPNIPGTAQVLAVTAVSQPSTGGSAAVAADGLAVVFTPTAGFKGSVAFGYVVSDGADSDGAAVTVTVGNAGPSAADDSAGTPYGTTVEIDVLDNDTDPNHDALSIAGVSVPRDADGHEVGTATVVGGTVRFAPPAGFSGTVTFGYTASDGDAGTSTATVTVVVGNGAPRAGDDTVVTKVGAAVTVPVLDDDSDPNGDRLTVVGTSTPAHGSVVVGSDGRLTYAPAPGWSGEDSFTYTVSDGHGGVALATVTVTVGNAAPAVRGEDVPVPVGSAPAPLVLGDPDGDPVTATVVAGELPPGLQLQPDGSFTGQATRSGTFTFTVQVCDDRTPAACSTQEVTLTVQAAATVEPTVPATPAPTAGPTPGADGTGAGPGDGSVVGLAGGRGSGLLGVDDSVSGGELADTGAQAGLGLLLVGGVVAVAGGLLLVRRRRH